MQTVFSTRGANQAEARQRWAAFSAREFYDGALDTASKDFPELVLDKGVVFPVSVTRLISRQCMGYRRSWQHIRANRAGARVMWFVRRGALKFVRPRGEFTVRSGQAGIVNTNAPFYGGITCGGDGIFESLLTAVPAKLFLAHFKGAESFTGLVELDCASGRLAKSLLDTLAIDGEHLSDKVVHALAACFLDALSHCTETATPDVPAHRRLVDKRFADIKSCILMHLTDPDLSVEGAAARCGISARYLSHILNANCTCFSEFLWNHRLLLAREQLTIRGTGRRLINDVAFTSGFKSAAHFCRMFKSAYGCTPREYRETFLSPST